MLGTECLSIWYLATNIQVTPAIPGVCVELTSGVCVWLGHCVSGKVLVEDGVSLDH